MRIFAVAALFIVSVAAKGSGPYLPSGWRPEGPAFYLPSEVQKPKENPVKDVLFQESIASGSDSFQEYGPPKVEVVPLELSKQGLPDVVIEQSFAVIEAKSQENVEEQVEVVTETQTIIGDSEANLSQQSFVQEAIPVTKLVLEETTPLVETEIIEEIQPAVEVTTQLVEVTTAVVENEEITQQNEAETPINEILANKDITTEVTQQENENANSNIVSTFQERVQVEEIQTVKEAVQKVETQVKSVETEVQKVETQVQNFETEVKTIVQEVQNIPELLNSIDNEVQQQQVETVQDVSAKVVQETFGTLEQAPEGFLEYGPPGFKEYGPPKEEVVPVAEVILPVQQTIDSNTNRRRRFSPKFRTARKANKQ
ncbi:uncharacterized protein LOC106712210 [Papilio machaon]|uniref:uncharacterized protein LOC106712210 n=1 Tax=Papilio machaon TaxID=76193 RepID=UPI001E6661F7|nr:uncharacterized protein LOC106712210 [Papilio machaon]